MTESSRKALEFDDSVIFLPIFVGDGSQLVSIRVSMVSIRFFTLFRIYSTRRRKLLNPRSYSTQGFTLPLNKSKLLGGKVAGSGVALGSGFLR